MASLLGMGIGPCGAVLITGEMEMSGECDKCGSHDHTEVSCPQAYPWDIEGFEKRIQKTGWPEWEQELPGATLQDPQIIVKYRLRQCAGGWVREINGNPNGDGKWAWNARIADHEAACLLREWFRAWVEERWVYVHPSVRGRDYCVKHGPIYGWLATTGRWENPPSDQELARFKTYDAAQTAAIDAVIAEEKEKEDEE